MTVDALTRFLMCALLLNWAVLLAWFLAWVFARRGLRRLHGRWFELTDTAFDAIHYCGMALYKIGILLFNLVPLLALWLTQHTG